MRDGVLVRRGPARLHPGVGVRVLQETEGGPRGLPRRHAALTAFCPRPRAGGTRLVRPPRVPAKVRGAQERPAEPGQPGGGGK